jgi:hypothetical protein
MGGWSREARIENPRSLAEVETISDSVERSTEGLVPKNDCSRGGCIPFQQKEDPGAACSGPSQVSGIVSLARVVELFRYRYNAGDGLPTP